MSEPVGRMNELVLSAGVEGAGINAASLPTAGVLVALVVLLRRVRPKNLKETSYITKTLLKLYTGSSNRIISLRHIWRCRTNRSWLPRKFCLWFIRSVFINIIQRRQMLDICYGLMIRLKNLKKQQDQPLQQRHKNDEQLQYLLQVHHGKLLLP